MTNEEYETIKQRILKGEQQLEGHWDDPRYTKHVTLYNELMEKRLEYEHANKLEWAKDHVCNL